MGKGLEILLVIAGALWLFFGVPIAYTFTHLWWTVIPAVILFFVGLAFIDSKRKS